MRVLLSVLTAVVLLAGVVAAAGPIDGKWVAERKMERDGQSFTIVQTFDFKSDGGKVTGTMTMQFGDMEPRSMEIQDGKLEGEKFSFATVMQTPNGDMKMVFNGTVEGDLLKGTAGREGGQGRPFEAKRK